MTEVLRTALRNPPSFFTMSAPDGNALTTSNAFKIPLRPYLYDHPAGTETTDSTEGNQNKAAAPHKYVIMEYHHVKGYLEHRPTEPGFLDGVKEAIARQSVNVMSGQVMADTQCRIHGIHESREVALNCIRDFQEELNQRYQTCILRGFMGTSGPTQSTDQEARAPNRASGMIWMQRWWTVPGQLIEFEHCLVVSLEPDYSNVG